MGSDEARAEAERRMREQREQVGLMVVEQTRFIEGFEQGAKWQEERDADRWAARAEAAEAKLAAVREIVTTPPRMLGQPVARWIDRLLTRLRAALDGDAVVTTIPTTIAMIDAGTTFVCTFEDEHTTDGELLEEAEVKLAAVRAFCVERTEGMPDDPFDYALQFALQVLGVIDGAGGVLRDARP